MKSVVPLPTGDSREVARVLGSHLRRALAGDLVAVCVTALTQGGTEETDLAGVYRRDSEAALRAILRHSWSITQSHMPRPAEAEPRKRRRRKV